MIFVSALRVLSRGEQRSWDTFVKIHRNKGISLWLYQNRHNRKKNCGDLIVENDHIVQKYMQVFSRVVSNLEVHP
jgi:hypothetical protein